MTKEPRPDKKDLRPLGLYIFLAGLSTLFGASLIGYLSVRLSAEVWPPDGMPPPPTTLWLSTFLLFVSSLTMSRAVAAARRADRRVLVRALTLTLLLGLTFLGSQIASGSALFAAALSRVKEVYSFTFVMLTSLHGVHVLGGFVPLTITIVNARRGRYTEGDHTGVELTATYWHFLGIVWLVLFLVIMA